MDNGAPVTGSVNAVPDMPWGAVSRPSRLITRPVLAW
jgi:hypothetical protein